MKHLAALLLLLALAVLACGRSNRLVTATPPSSPTLALSTPTIWSTGIPPEYLKTYDDLNTSLDDFLASMPPGGGQVPVFAAELAYANGNIGEALLRPEILPLVRKQLDALHDLGVRGVVVGIKFPLLEASFPRSAEYLQFYKQVGTEIHQRGMKFLVEVGPVFSGTIFSPLNVDWRQYTLATFQAAQQDELVTIATEIGPDYLQIADEPTTIAMLTGFRMSVAEYAGFIRSSAEKIGHPNGLLLAAGAGTWEDPAYLNDLMNIPGLDCIDLHIYPIGKNAALLQRAYAAAQQAHAAGKRVAISEAGLYKVNSSELSTLGGDYARIYSRDTFSLFEPLDEKFIQALTQMSRAGGIEFVSFFWTRSFFAYLDYDQVHTDSDAEINRLINQASLTAMQSGAVSPLGIFYQNWISEQTR
jgi:hypothetical protein